jgi:membrane protease YdiL (CAAX protease family)
MAESAPRWPFGGWKRAIHAIACVAAFDLWQILAFGFVFGVLGCSPAGMWAGGPAVIATTVVSGSLAMACVVWLGIVRLGRVSWSDLGWHTERLGTSLALGAAGTALLAATLLGLLAASVRLAPADLLSTLTGYTPAQRLLFLAIGASAAAIEESLFRGYLQPALIAKTGLVGGIAIGAAIFSLYHLFMGPSPLNLFGKLLVGLILGGLRARRNSLVAPALAHFAFWQIFGSL